MYDWRLYAHLRLLDRQLSLFGVCSLWNIPYSLKKGNIPIRKARGRSVEQGISEWSLKCK